LAAGSVMPDDTKQLIPRPVPSTLEPLPVIGIGTWQTFDVGAGAAERAPLREVLKAFAAGGGRVLDSSPMYGAAESVAGDLIDELGLRAAVHRNQGLDQRTRRRHAANGGVVPPPESAEDGPHAGTQPGGCLDPHENPPRVETQAARALHRHHPLHVVGLCRGRALAEDEAIRFPADQLLPRRARC